MNSDSLLGIDLDLAVFGTFCSVSGEPPATALQIIKFVNNGDYDKLSKYLTSLNPEIAAYGYLGLKFLEIKGYQLKESEVYYMKKLETQNLIIYSCEGCNYGIKNTFIENLNSDKINFYFKNLKGQRFIK